MIQLKNNSIKSDNKINKGNKNKNQISESVNNRHIFLENKGYNILTENNEK